MTYDITLYFGTGFDTVNLPASPTLLEQVARSTKTYSTNYLVQNTDFTSVRVADTFDNVKNADYCRIGSDRYYAVTGISMMNDNCAELGLSMDYLLSMGGIYSNNFRYFGATATRITPQNPSTDYNYLQEPFNPAMPIDTTTVNAGFPAHSAGNMILYGMTVDLQRLTEDKIIDAVKFGSEETEAGQVPALPLSSLDATIYQSGTTQPVASLPGESIYDFTTPDTQQQEALRAIQSLGISDAIVDRYVLPAEWGDIALKSGTTEHPNYYANDLFFKTYSAAVALPGISGYSPNNAKTLSLYAQLMIASSISGDMHAYHWGEVETPGNHGTATLAAFADPSPNGAPYCGPAYYNGAAQVGVMQKVKGAAWYKPQMLLQGASGSALRAYQAANQINDLGRHEQWAAEKYHRTENWRAAGLAVGAGIGAIRMLSGDVVGGLGTLAQTAGSIDLRGWTEENIARQNEKADYQDRINDIATATSMSNNIFTPTYKSAEGDSLSMLFPNNFRILTANLAASDAAALDRYLTKFGYAVPGEQITASDLNRGRYFCYVQCGEIQFGDAPSIPRYIRNGAIAQLLGGVRIWKRKPDVSLYSQSNQPV